MIIGMHRTGMRPDGTIFSYPPVRCIYHDLAYPAGIKKPAKAGYLIVAICRRSDNGLRR